MLCTITKSIQKPRGSLNETRTTAVGVHLLGLPSLGRTPVHRHQWTTFRAREDGTWDWKAELRLKAGAPSRCKLFVSSPLQPRRNLLEGDRDIFIPRLLHLDTHTLPSTIVILATFLLGLQPHSQLTSPPLPANTLDRILPASTVSQSSWVATDTMFHLSSALLALVSLLALRPTSVSAVSLEDVFRNRTGSSTFRWLIRVSPAS